jgi:hypothetical protein
MMKHYIEIWIFKMIRNKSFYLNSFLVLSLLNFTVAMTKNLPHIFHKKPLYYNKLFYNMIKKYNSHFYELFNETKNMENLSDMF